MQDDFDAAIKREFLSEAVEILETVERSFIDLERNPQEGAVIDKIFRLAHTIKGSALSCGFMGLGEFAHVIETLLSKLRDRELQVDRGIMDILLRANDRFREYMNVLSQDFDANLPVQDIVTEVQKILSGGSSTEKPVTAHVAPTPQLMPAPAVAPFIPPPPPVAQAMQEASEEIPVKSSVPEAKSRSAGKPRRNSGERKAELSQSVFRCFVTLMQLRSDPALSENPALTKAIAELERGLHLLKNPS